MPIEYSSTIDVAEVADSAQETGGEGGFSASVALRVAWADRHAFVTELFSTLRYWPYLLAAKAIPISATISNFGGKSIADGQGVTYEYAIIQVNYKQVESAGAPGSEVFFSEELSPTAEFITLDHTNFKWGAAGGADKLKPAEAPGRLVISFDYCQTRYRMATVPTAYLTAVGGCNSGAITSATLGLTFPAQTLLFNPPKLTRSLGGDNALWTAAAKFTYRQEGWNKYWRAKTQTYENIYVGATVYNSYPPVSFAGILV